MNNSTVYEMSYYNQNSVNTIEKVILAEDLTFSSFDSVYGKFFIPSSTPSLEMENATEKKTSKYTSSNYIELPIPTHFLIMFMQPQIVPVEDIDHTEEPMEHIINGGIKYILGFSASTFSIPKGTEFLIECLGGEMELDNMSIVGIYSLPQS